MQAVVYLGAGDTKVKIMAKPRPGPGEVLVQVQANTICGTDLRIASGGKSKGVQPPVILGHELAGFVAEVGSGVTGLDIGDMVGMTPSIACNNCPQCQLTNYNLCAHARVLGHDVDGGLAEYFLVPAAAVDNGNLVKAPQTLSPEEIALAEPLSCVLHGQDLMGLRGDDVVVVVGGGAIGQLHAQLAKARGARKVIVSEPVASRRELALKLGADEVVDPLTEDLAAVVNKLSDNRGADAVIVCIGVPQLINGALSIAAQRGKVCLFAGFPKETPATIDANLIHYKELFVTGSSNSTTTEYRDALAMIAEGKINVKSLVTHNFPLTRIEEALATAGSPDALKVAVSPEPEHH
jgi:L-iditol 2-dehydrogenase